MVQFDGSLADIEQPGVIEIGFNRANARAVVAAQALSGDDPNDVAVLRFGLQELSEHLAPDPRVPFTPYYMKLVHAWIAAFEAAAERLRSAVADPPVVYSPALGSAMFAARAARAGREQKLRARLRARHRARRRRPSKRGA